MGYRVQARVGVQAPAFAVWSVLSDLETWKDWNPLITEAEGRLAIGANLRLRRVRPDGVGEAQEVRVLDWVPNEQILWIRTPGPFARVVGFLEIEALSETACLLSVGEVYDGFVGERMGYGKRRPLTAAWQGLADAAKARAEETWDGTPGETVPPPPPKPKAAVKKMQPKTMSMFGRK